MFLILPLLLLSGLLSILTIAVVASAYGLLLIILALTIRNVRQESSRKSLRRFLQVIAFDHLLSAGIALCCGVLVAASQNQRGIVPLLDNSDETGTLLVTLASILFFFAVLWVLAGVLLLLIGPDLDSHISIHRQLRWNVWTRVMIAVGLFLSLSTALLMLLISAPLLWHLLRMARMSRQSTLVWTLAIAVRQNLPLGPEVLSISEGLWGYQRLRLQLLSENLDAGSSLATSLERQPGLVPLSVVMMIRMGEETKILGAALDNCATSYAHHQELASDLLSVQQAFLLLLVPLLIIPNLLGFLGYYIVPKYKKIFQDFGTELPGLTQLVVEITNPSSGVFFLMFMGSLGFVLFLLILNMRDWERDWPLLNWLAPRINGPPILRGFALLIREKRSLPAGVQGMMWSHPRATVRRRLGYIHLSLQQGADLANCLAAERLIRRGDIPLLRAAERVQNLPWCLEQLAESIESKFWYRIRVFLEMGFPVAVVGIGILVLVITAGYFLPLVKLLNDLS